MKFFEPSSRPAVRGRDDIYEEKTRRLTEEARGLFQQGRLTDSEDKIRELIQLQSKVVGEKHSDYAGGLTMLAELLLAREELDDAEILLQRAMEIRKKLFGTEHPEYAATLDLLGRVYSQWGDLEAAEPLLKKALQIRRQSLGEDHLDSLESLAALAEVLRRREEYKAAEPLLRQACEIRKRLVGEEDPDYAGGLASLADVLARLGQADEAEPLLRQAVELRKLHLGETHPDYVATLTSLASLLHVKGKLDEAEQHLQLILEMRKQSLGADHPECANIVTQLGLLKQRRGDLRAAEGLLKSALEIRKLALGERHPEYATALDLLAQVMQKLGDLQGAEPLLRQAMAIRKDILGTRHPEYASSLMNLAHLVQKRGDLAWARMLFKEASEVRQAIHGEMHPDYAQSLAALADVVVHQGDSHAKAQMMLTKALEIRRRTLGPDHPAVAVSLASLAALMRRQGEFDAAESHLLQALEIRLRVLGEYHPDYATNLGNLAWLLQRKGDIEAAEAYLGRALEIRARIFGEDHPEYLQNLERLQALQSEAHPQRVAVEEPPPPDPIEAPIDEDQCYPEEAGLDVEPVGELEQYSRIAPLWTPDPTDPHAEDRASKLFGESPGGRDLVPPDPHATAVSQIYEDYEQAIHDNENQSGEIDEYSSSPDLQGDSWPVTPESELVAEDGFPVDAPELDSEEVSGEFAALGDSEDSWSDSVADHEPIEASISPEPAYTTYEPAPVVEDEEPWQEEMTTIEEAPLSDPPTDATLEASETPADPAAGPITLGNAMILDTRDHDEEPPVQAEPTAVNAATTDEPLLMARSEPMSQSSTALSQELAELSDRFSELGERLLAAARQLHAPGLPPSDELLDGLASCRQVFLDLRDRAFGLAGSIPLPCPLPEEVESLTDLNGLLEQVADAESRQSKVEELRIEALRVIDRFLLVGHSSGPDFAPLAECHDSARSLRHAIVESGWASLPEDVEALASGDHPYACLVILIDTREDLDDEEWARLHETVGQHLGKSLAAAAARSKLVIRPDEQAQTSSSEMAYSRGH